MQWKETVDRQMDRWMDGQTDRVLEPSSVHVCGEVNNTGIESLVKLPT